MSKYSTLIDGMELAQIPAKQILEAIKHMEAATKPAKKTTKTARKEYTEEFESFWQQYPDKRNNTKSNAADEWEKLDAADRLRALQTLVPYRKQLKEPNAPSCIHAERFLKYRRFDSFDGPQLALVAKEKVELTSSRRDHMFLFHCRADGANESDINYWANGRFSVEDVTINGQRKLVCVVSGELGYFEEAFSETKYRLKYSVWNKKTWDREKEKQA